MKATTKEILEKALEIAQAGAGILLTSEELHVYWFDCKQWRWRRCPTGLQTFPGVPPNPQRFAQ